MENASKALLIAAAVLIAIIIVSLALMLITSNSDTVSEGASTLDSASVEAFNNKFLCYLSNSAPGATAKALAQAVLQNNASINKSHFSPEDHHVYLNFYPPNENSNGGHHWKPSAIQNNVYNKISNTKRYKISVTQCGGSYSGKPFTGGYYNGYVICLSISELPQ